MRLSHSPRCPGKKRKVEDKLNAEEMEELTSWIFSLEAVDLAMQLWSTTLSDLCINCFAKKLLSDVQKQHFQLSGWSF